VLADIVALEISVALGYLLRSAAIPWFPVELTPATYEGVAIGVLVLPITYFLARLYPGYRLPAVERLRRRVYSTVVVFGLLVIWDNLVQHGTWSRGLLLATFAFAIILTPLAELFVRKLLVATERWGIPVLLIGGGEIGRRLLRLLKEQPHLGLVPIAFLDDDASKWGKVMDGVPVVGPISRAGEFGERASLAIVTMTHAPMNRVVALSNQLPFARVIVVPDLIGLPSLWTEPCDIAGVLGIEFRNNLFFRRNRIIKRFLDYSLALPLFMVALPFIGVLAVAVKLTSPGPAFYFQERGGLGEKTIRIVKLRTMYTDAETRLAEHLGKDPEVARKWKRRFKLDDDPRVISWLGPFLRKFSLDELPQLWNVLRGDMSLVGPRPLPLYHLTAFDPIFRELRASVPPGLTGFWQVEQRNASDTEAQKALDTYYIRNWSLWFDLHILLRTMGAVLSGKGAQ
jgi:Undecaprenyl-phosphate galactose phosphotransferase WbaP